MTIRKITAIGRSYRHARRYREILTVLVKYGFGDLIDSLKIAQYLEIGLRMISRQRREKIEFYSRAERVRMAIEELGPSFVKMGQIVSTRPDLVPVEFLRELARLQDEVPPVSFTEVRQVVETELHSPVQDVFEEFAEAPLASASLGQVHRARLPGGQWVAVKVQRPNIRQRIAVDLEILFHLATLMDTHLEGWDVQNPTRIVEEFGRTLEKELDYGIEAAHMERFARQFAKESVVYVPKVYRELSSPRVLTMEYVEGIKPSQLDRLEKAGLDRQEVARRGADLIMKQVFVHGFFHADPHPGNIFILSENVICYLDYGMMGRLDRRSRENFANLILAIVRRDARKTAAALQKLTRWDKQPDEAALEREVAELMDRYLYRPLKELELGKLLHQLLDLTTRHRLRVPPDLFLMLKALSTVEGVGRMLDPEFDYTEAAAPFVRRLEFERLDPRRIAAEMWGSGTELAQLFKDAPGELRELFRQLRQGKVKIEFEHRGLDPVISTLDRVSNRLAFAVVLASLIVGSSLIVHADIPPKWHEIPVIGLTGFLISAVMGFWLLVAMSRHGRM